MPASIWELGLFEQDAALPQMLFNLDSQARAKHVVCSIGKH